MAFGGGVETNVELFFIFTKNLKFQLRIKLQLSQFWFHTYKWNPEFVSTSSFSQNNSGSDSNSEYHTHPLSVWSY
jgi:hypothetical protein